MKLRLIIPAAIALAATACAPVASTDYDVTIPVDNGLTGLTAYIVNYDTGDKIDSAYITDGMARFRGAMEDMPVLARVIVDGRRAGVFVLEAGTITVDTVSRTGRGTPLNDAFAAYALRCDSIETAYGELPADSGGNVRRGELMAMYDDYNAAVLAENADNPIGYYVFMQKAYEMDSPTLEGRLKEMPGMAGYARVKKLRHSLAKAAATGEGAMYTDFAVAYNDSTYRLSDHVGRDGKFTLVDFWASWCGPCIKETRVIKEIYGRHGGDVNVVGVAVWDEPENTLRAIAAHQLPWPQIINADTIPTEIYGISGIPCILLIDPEGRIVSRGKQGAELSQAVDGAIAAYKAKARGAGSDDTYGD